MQRSALTREATAYRPRQLLGGAAMLFTLLAATACDPEPSPQQDTSVTDTLGDIGDPGKDTTDTTDTPQSKLAPSIHGTVAYRVGNLTFAAARAEKRIRSEDDAAYERTSTTSIFGDLFVAAGQKPGNYVVCTSAPELPEYCQPKPFTLPQATSDEGVRTRQVKLGQIEHPVTTPAIYGRVSLADKSMCIWRFPLHGVEVDGAVEVSFDNKFFKATVNHEGQFLLPLPAAARGKTLTLRGSCGSSSASVPVLVGEGPVEANVTLPNRPPRPIAISLTEEGKAVRALKWGHSYKATVRFADDTPVAEVRWLTSVGALVVDGQSATWTVETPIEEGESPAPAAISAGIEALVSDGKGGYALLAVTFPADIPHEPRGGVTDSSGAAIAGATVTFKGTTTTTNDTGYFVLPEGSWSSDAPLRISAPGYVDRVIYASSSLRGVALPLKACEVVTLDAKAGGLINLPSDPGAITLNIQSGSALSAPGVPFNGTLSACLATLDPADGDWSLGTLTNKSDASGATLGFAPGAGVWLDFRDAADLSRRITFSKPVQLTLRAPAEASNLATWTPAAETFVNTGAPTPTDGVIRTEIAGTTALTPMTPNPMTCVRLYLDGLLHRGDYLLRYRIIEPGVNHHWQFQLVVPGVERLGPLPANRNVEIEVVDMRTSSPNGAPVADWTRTIATGPDPRRSVLTQHPFPFEACGNELVLPPEAPSTGVDFLSRFVPDFGGASVTDVSAHLMNYVNAAGFPQFTRTSLYNALGMERGTTMPWEVTALFNNVLDLGFVRRVLFKEVTVPTGTRTIIAVENGLELMQMLDGHANPENAVVMVGTPPSVGAEPIVIFRAVLGGGAGVQIAVDLDDRGLKPVPYVCMSCHGGDYLGPTIQPWPANADIGARFLPFAPDTFAFAGPADTIHRPWLATTYTRAAQEPAFRMLNEAILKTGVGPTTRRMIHGHYGSSDPSGNTLPVANFDDSWVPPGDDSQGWADRPDLYREVVSPFCRTCHQSFDHIDFRAFDGFGQRAGLIEQQVCVNRTMPHAALTYDKFWTSSNPYAPGLLNRAMAGVPNWLGNLCP